MKYSLAKILLICFSCSLLISQASQSFAQSTVRNKSKTADAKQDDEKQDEDDNDGDKSDDKDNDEKEEKEIKTVTAEVKPIFVYKSFEGVFESTRTQEVKTDFDTWTDLKIEDIVEEGTAVSAGQQLIQFDTESIQKAVAEAAFAAANSEFDFKTAQLDKQQSEKTFELDQKIAENSWKHAKEDYDYYLRTELPQRLDDLDFSEKTAGYYFEYSKDELDQLEQMYTEDELTEESEEIVLKRARRDVESSGRSMDRTLRRVKHSRETEIPREETEQANQVLRSEMDFQRSSISLPIQKRKSEVAFQQAEFNLQKNTDKLQKIESDLKKMTLKSPGNGVLYYGRCVRGKWSGPKGGSRRLEPEGKVPANAVVLTIVDINQMMIRASVAEEDLHSLAGDSAWDAADPLVGRALITSAGQKTLGVKIKSISRIPLDDGKFDCQIQIDRKPAGVNLMPGMTCKLSFLVHKDEAALAVPKASVFTDNDGVTHYVYIMADEKPVRHAVTIGHTSDDDIEIVEGLSAGDKIAKEKP